MIQHVFEKALQSGASRVIIATDNENVADVAKKFWRGSVHDFG